MKTKTILAFLLPALLLTACNLPVSMMKSSGSASIIYPLDGAQFQVGDFVDVKTIAALPSAATSAILYVNDAPYRADNLTQPVLSGTLYQPWTPIEPGTFTLRVRLVTPDGEVDSNSVTVIVGAVLPATLSLEAPSSDPTETFLPTATLQPGETAVITQQAAPTDTAPPPQVIPSLTPTFIPPSTLTPTVIVLANASITGLVFRDENGNGNFNPADTPLIGITVQLGVGNCSSSGLQSTQTNGEGRYTFSGLFAGTYCVTVSEGSLPNIGGIWQASLPNPKTISVNESESKGGQNFMFQPIIQ